MQGRGVWEGKERKEGADRCLKMKLPTFWRVEGGEEGKERGRRAGKQ